MPTGVYEVTESYENDHIVANDTGIEINAIVSALEPIDEERVDHEIWAILRWVIEGVGPPWTVQDLDATGRLYRVPAAQGPI